MDVNKLATIVALIDHDIIRMHYTQSDHKTKQ
jgi:hypothetical protein